MSDDKLLCVFGIVIMITKLIKLRKKQRKISQIFQNKFFKNLFHHDECGSDLTANG